VRGIDEMMRILEGLPGRLEVHQGVGRGYGRYHVLLRPLTSRVLPGQLRLIIRSKDKDDRNDAERLAKLLYMDEKPAVHVLSPQVRAWRELVNSRGGVIAGRTRAKHAARALLRGAGVVPRGNPPRGRGGACHGSVG
jgi:transposase